jgi:hypothetical protein
MSLPVEILFSEHESLSFQSLSLNYKGVKGKSSDVAEISAKLNPVFLNFTVLLLCNLQLAENFQFVKGFLKPVDVKTTILG